MLDKVISLVKTSKPLQLVVVFIAGAVVSAVFYPTKQIKETLQKTYQQQISALQSQQAQTLATQQASYQKLSNEYSGYKTQTDAKINDLTTQVTNLRSHTKTTMLKIIHPDGTVEERDSSESDTDQTEQVTQQLQQEWQQKTDQTVQTITQQYQQQISTLQSQWSSKEQSYQSQISTLSQTKTETINPKDFMIEAGMLTDSSYFWHLAYDVWGPFTLGVQAQFGLYPATGVSVGIKF
jgi:hypothetical protein